MGEKHNRRYPHAVEHWESEVKWFERMLAELQHMGQSDPLLETYLTRAQSVADGRAEPRRGLPPSEVRVARKNLAHEYRRAGWARIKRKMNATFRAIEAAIGKES